MTSGLFDSLPVHLSPRLAAKAAAKASGRGVVCNPLPSQAYLRECFDYEAESGLLRWRVRPIGHFRSIGGARWWNSRCAGGLVGHCDSGGYLGFRLDGVSYLVARIVLALHGVDAGQLHVDHIDGDRSNNRLENLRVVTHRQNSENRRVHRAGRVLPVGVYCQASGRFRCSASIAGVDRHLGVYDTPEQAAAARAEFLKRHEGKSNG